MWGKVSCLREQNRHQPRYMKPQTINPAIFWLSNQKMDAYHLPVHHRPTTNTIINIIYDNDQTQLFRSKTNFMEFKTRQKKYSFNFSVVINEIAIAQVNETVFLGETLRKTVSLTWLLVLDENLTWKSHISSLAYKISKSIGIIFISSFFLSTPSLCMLYNSMTLPYLNYCNLTWGSA